MMINKLHIIFIITSLTNGCFSQSPQKLDIEKVKIDLLSSCFTDVELDLTDYFEESPMEIFYSKEYALVHIEYRTDRSEAFMKQSTALVYKWQNNSWSCLNTFPYNYSIKQIDQEHGFFLSDNFICDNIGSCGRYIEVQKLRNDSLNILKSFEGFSKYAYWNGRLSLQKEDEIKEAIGDTIEMDYKILNYNITQSGKLLLELKNSIKVLKGFDEYDILTNDSHVITTYEIK